MDLERFGFAFEVEEAYRLGDGLGEEGFGAGPDGDSSAGCLALDPGGDVDRVADDCVGPAALGAEQADRGDSAVDADPELRPVGMCRRTTAAASCSASPAAAARAAWSG